MAASCAAWAQAKLAALDKKPAIVRYERERPGELIHLDTKKLGRIAGVGHRITGRRPGAIDRPNQSLPRRRPSLRRDPLVSLQHA